MMWLMSYIECLSFLIDLAKQESNHLIIQYSPRRVLMSATLNGISLNGETGLFGNLQCRQILRMSKKIENYG